MKSSAILMATMGLLVACMACSNQGFPTGVYVPAQPASTDRVTELSFSGDGTFACAYYDRKAATGTYAIKGDKITLTELNEDSPCLGAPATMSWTTNGDGLTLKFYEDLCREGPSYDWNRQWARKP